ncbi:MAG: hypothetical protein M1347_00805 [Chloroflexi bacterium]|nr:hypothetical protein [Chloroflexota bacterium]
MKNSILQSGERVKKLVSRLVNVDLIKIIFIDGGFLGMAKQREKNKGSETDKPNGERFTIGSLTKVLIPLIVPLWALVITIKIVLHFPDFITLSIYALVSLLITFCFWDNYKIGANRRIRFAKQFFISFYQSAILWVLVLIVLVNFSIGLFLFASYVGLFFIQLGNWFIKQGIDFLRGTPNITPTPSVSSTSTP